MCHINHARGPVNFARDLMNQARRSRQGFAVEDCRRRGTLMVRILPSTIRSASSGSSFSNAAALCTKYRSLLWIYVSRLMTIDRLAQRDYLFHLDLCALSTSRRTKSPCRVSFLSEYCPKMMFSPRFWLFYERQIHLPL